MDLEIFDENYTQQARLVVEIYKNDKEIIPNWWLEIIADDEFDPSDLLSLASCFPAIERQIENLVKAVE